VCCNVTDAVWRVYFQQGDGAELTDERTLHQRVESGSLVWTDGVPGALTCIGVGGYPPPTVDIRLDLVDVTHQFSMSYSATLHGMRGLRVITYTSERSDHVLMMKTIVDEFSYLLTTSLPSLVCHTCVYFLLLVFSSSSYSLSSFS